MSQCVTPNLSADGFIIDNYLLIQEKIYITSKKQDNLAAMINSSIPSVKTKKILCNHS